MFSKTPIPRLNPFNFAVNQRPYDPTKTQTFYDPNMLGKGAGYQWTNTSVNADTALGMPWIH